MSEAEVVSQYCRHKLDLGGSVKPEEPNYASLPLCIVDTVYSIGALYSSTDRTVKQFCEYAHIPRLTEKSCSDAENQYSVRDMLDLYRCLGVQNMAERVFQNCQRTSSRNGILKAEAVLRFCQVLDELGASTLRDSSKIIGNDLFEARIKVISGHNSGISTRYLYILLGSQDYVKPDRMVMRFLESATGKHYSADECQRVLVQVSQLLVTEYPGLTPSRLDHLIWVYQRNVQ